MVMIPVTFLPAAGLIFLIVLILVRFTKTLSTFWLIAFLCSLVLQLVLLGVRYGYGIEAVLDFQHLTGVLIPPLGFLAFTNPSLSGRTTIHALPIITIGLVVTFASYLADAILACITLGYAFSLVVVWQRQKYDVFSWAPLRYEAILCLGLWMTVSTLVLSGITDALIAADFLATGGARTTAIAATASFGSLVLLTLCGFLFLRSNKSNQAPSTSSYDLELVQRLTSEIETQEIFRDPDLTLSRLAKRLSLPAREISQAVNRSLGLNMSQFVNNMRISEVCRILIASDVSVTTAMLDAGFYTKSNFNREFRRVMGQSPTEWRASLKQNNAEDERQE